MKKLKTLKDLNLGEYADIGYEGTAFVCEKELKEILKQEAIKHIKEIQTGAGELVLFATGQKEVINYIKWFFNISKEEINNASSKSSKS